MHRRVITHARTIPDAAVTPNHLYDTVGSTTQLTDRTDSSSDTRCSATRSLVLR
jgi:hypothetical protein